MATIKPKTNNDRKISFGSRKLGSAQKSFNKHNRKERNYRSQGR